MRRWYDVQARSQHILRSVLIRSPFYNEQRAEIIQNLDVQLSTLSPDKDFKTSLLVETKVPIDRSFVSEIG